MKAVLIFIISCTALAVAVTTSSRNLFQEFGKIRNNYYRRLHNAADLKLNNTLNVGAQQWAEQLAREGRLYDPVGVHGENLWKRDKSYGSAVEDVSAAVASWYSQINKYNFNSPGYYEGTGYFTQVVWKSSSSVGFGWAKAADGSVYVVARYWPWGIQDQQDYFVRNVLPRQRA